MDSEQLLALAVRCEQATGPDRELADEIMLAVGWQRREFRGTFGWITPEGRQCSARHVPDPIASLDAAMGLVPEGCFYGFLMDGNGDGFIACCQFAGPDQAPPDLLWAKAATPALALTAASLRALAASMKDGTHVGN